MAKSRELRKASSSFTEHVIAGEELYIKSFYTFGPQSTWHIKIKIHLAIPNNMHVISVIHFHKKRLMTKSNDDNSDFTSGQVSKP